MTDLDLGHSTDFDQKAALTNGAVAAPQQGAAANGKDHADDDGTSALSDVDIKALAAIKDEFAAVATLGPNAVKELRRLMLTGEIDYLDRRKAFSETYSLPLGTIGKLRRKFESERKKAERQLAGVEKDENAKAAADAAILPVEQRHFLDLTETERQQEAVRTWPLCEEIARDPDILKRGDNLLTAAGVTGEGRIKRAVLLAGVARLFADPTNLIIKGPSASGKSWPLSRTLALLQPAAVLVLTDMSEKALAYLPEGSLRHRIVIILEATPIQKDDHSTKAYFMRALMSEGEIIIVVTEKDPKTGKFVAHERKQKGPTAFIVTTTATTLHAENETRALSIETDDSQRQTGDILLSIAGRSSTTIAAAASDAPLAWHAFYRYIEVAGPHTVIVPYIDWLALNANRSAIRMRRDFMQLKSLIEASAVMHLKTRARGANNEIIAAVQDYANALGIIYRSAAEAAGLAVPPRVAKIWKIIYDLVKTQVDRQAFTPVPGEKVDDTATATARRDAMWRQRVSLSEEELAARAGLTRSTGQRALAKAMSTGVIIKEPGRSGVVSTWGLGVPELPKKQGVFPTVDKLKAAETDGWDGAAIEASWRRGPGRPAPSDDEEDDGDDRAF
jgi:hypothetical protein